MPPAALRACNIFELPFKVYIPGLYAFPETTILISLMFTRATKTSVAINEFDTFNFIKEIASLKLSFETLIFPIPWRLIVPSLPIGNSFI